MSGIFHEAGFWVAVSFVLFFVLVGKKIWGPIATILDSRANRIREELDEAARLRREAEQMLEDATRDREQALAEAKSYVEQAHQQAAEMAQKARAEAEAAVQRHEQMARDRIAAVERAAVKKCASWQLMWPYRLPTVLFLRRLMSRKPQGLLIRRWLVCLPLLRARQPETLSAEW